LDPNVLGVKESLELLRKSWKVEQDIYDLHVGLRSDVVDFPVTVDKVIFHIPKLQKDNLFVLWNCLWPDCHNCCDRQGRLPLTKEDILTISHKLGYTSTSTFLKNETRIASWEEDGLGSNIITTLSMISLKRKVNETDEED
jgi:hypothetical protein